MNKRLQFILFSLLVCASSGAQTDFSFPADKGVMNVRNFDFEEIKSKDGSTARIKMDYDFSDLKVGTNRFLAMTPVLVSKDKRYMKAFRSTVVSGNRQYIVYERDGKLIPGYEEGEVIRLKDAQGGRPVSYVADVVYEPWMSGAYLYFAKDLCGCCELKDTTFAGPFVRTAIDPVSLLRYSVPALATDSKIYKLKGSAYINFVVDRWELNAAYMNNPRELRKITDTLNIMAADKNVTVDTIKIHGYASPESPYAHNQMLATNRAQTIADYVRNLYPMIPAGAFAPAEATPENWGDLRDSVAISDLNHKSEILAIIDEALRVPEGQKNRCDALEARIKMRYPEEYRYLLKTVYPHLRRTDYEVSFTVRKFSDAEAEEILKRQPGYLSAEELAHLAKIYQVGGDDYKRVFSVARANFADNERSNLILAVAALEKGDVSTAKEFLDKSGKSPEAENARGAYHLILRDYDKAKTCLEVAKSAGVSVATDNLQVLEEVQ